MKHFLTVLLAGLILLGCSERERDPGLSNQLSQNPFIALSYTALITGYSKFSDEASDDDLLSLNQTAPHVRKEFVKLHILHDGSSEMQISSLPVETRTGIIDEGLPSDLPQQTHSIYRGDLVTYYDDEWNELDQAQIQSMDFREVVSMITSGVLKPSDLTSLNFLKQYQVTGNEFSPEPNARALDEGNYKTVTNIETDAATGISWRQVLIAERATGRLIISKLHNDTSGQLVSATAMEYDEADGSLTYEQTEFYETTPGGRPVTRMQLTDYDDFHIAVSID